MLSWVRERGVTVVELVLGAVTFCVVILFVLIGIAFGNIANAGTTSQSDPVVLFGLSETSVDASTHFVDWRWLRPGPEARAGTAAIGTIAFAPGSSEIDRSGIAVLAEMALVLQNNPEIILALEGYAGFYDGVAHPSGLATRRAKSVRGQLLSHGLEEDRLTLVSFGEGQALRFATQTSPALRIVLVTATIDTLR